MTHSRTSPEHSPVVSNLSDPAFRSALKLFKKTADQVPAYKDFLSKAKIDAAKIETPQDFAQVPPTDKKNYITAYPLPALCWGGTLEHETFISSSSGSTGVPFYWPRGNHQYDVTGKIFQKIYQDIFDTAEGRTLFVNLFALGTWIAGLEFYNATKFVSDKVGNITIVTPGIDRSTAVDTIKRLAPFFDRIVLAGYPPFVKDIIETGASEGIVWSSYDIRLLTGGEPFSELWRDRVLESIGKKGSYSSFVNVFGMAETGIVGHETPFTTYARRQSEDNPHLHDLFMHDGNIAAMYQYDPLYRYLEVGEEDTLMLTSHAGLPLIRYNTRDQGGIRSYRDMTKLLPPPTPAQESAIQQKWRLPLVYLFGRRDLSLSFYALNIYVENIKFCLETFSEAKLFSGLFIMQVGHTKELNQQFEIKIELARGKQLAKIQPSVLAQHITRTLCTVNSEYAKLYSVLGVKARPKITLVPYGQIDTMPGRKHRWVKRA